MKSVHEMTSFEIENARKSGAKVYGTVMRRASRVNRGEYIYSDQEDFCPFALRAIIARMKGNGWQEVPGNRYVRAGLHPNEHCDRADSNLARMASDGPPLC